MPQPTIDLPEGLQFAAQKPRLMAFALDVFVMFVILLGLQTLVLDRVTESWYPDEHAELSAIEDDPAGSEDSRIEEARQESEDADEAADEAEDNNEDDAAELRADADAKEQEYDDLLDDQTRLGRKMYPAFLFVLGIAMTINFLYLFIPSGISGQTLGKKTRKIRVVHVDGSPLGWGGALVRYGLLILAGTVLFLFAGMFGILGLLLVGGLFFLVLGWMRNPNKQALQDRVAKTIVVDA